MLNQASREALYSATYMEDYLDCVENMPDDLQRSLTRLRELDVKYQTVLAELERRQAAVTKEDNEVHRTKIILSMQRSLIVLQEVADEKLHVLQSVHDLVDGRCRQLEFDYKNLDYGKGQENQEPSAGSRSVTPPAAEATPARATASSAPRRRPRRARTSERVSAAAAAAAAAADDSNDTKEAAEETPPPARQGKPGRSSTAAGSNAKERAGSAAKRRKRKARQEREDSPTDVPIDPDEPTYCLCEQVFFGEMIGCDNELCPIEWFHFSCVSIVHKPKGKWYCPRCRGDRMNVMKPKQLFLRELDKFNRQKREERERQRTGRE